MARKHFTISYSTVVYHELRLDADELAGYLNIDVDELLAIKPADIALRFPLDSDEMSELRMECEDTDAYDKGGADDPTEYEITCEESK